MTDPDRRRSCGTISPAREVDVAVVDGTGRLGDGLEWLGEHVSAAVSALGARGSVRVRVVDDAEMSAAHARFAGVEGTTDVLTFDLSDGPGSGAGERRVLDVDILACLDEAERQGQLRGHSAERELLLYAVHGVLHALGHDDRDEAGFARMHAAEDEVLERVGVGRTFERGGP